MAENSSYKEENLTRIEQFITDIRIYYVDDVTAKIYGQIKAGFIHMVKLTKKLLEMVRK
ncbi:hypothetical protein [Dolichospermum flos-aquae]|nr:hypothetical protein [Dolichospermum flos-aquae]